MLPTRTELVVNKKFSTIRGSLLLDAAANGDDKKITQLLDGGIPIEAKDKHGSTPLLLAAKNNRPSTAQLLLERNANINATTRLKATPLIAAASHGHAAIVKLLLAAGADRSMQIDGMTALTLARRQGKAEVVGILEAAAEGKRKNAASEQRGIWSGKIGQAE